MEREPLDLPSKVAIDFISAALELHAASRSKDQPIVFSDEPDRFPMWAVPEDRWASRNPSNEVERPSSGLLAKFVAQGGASALRQSGAVRNFLTDQHFSYGPGAVKRARASVSGPGISGPVFEAEIVSLTLPVVGEDETEALLSSVSESGVHMASGNYYYLRSDDEGMWTIRSVTARWMS